MIARDFAELIADARQRGENWTGRCPAHEDHRPSLSWRDGELGLVLHCHRGCRVEEICGALGIPISTLFRESNGRGPARDADPIICTYDYVDQARQLLFQVVRTVSKRFWQRRPGPDGGWVNGLGDTARVLYHLDRLRGQHQVAIAEGEKDVDNLWALGIPATCNPMGAGKWTAAHTQQLVEAGVTTVVLFADNDTAGQEHVKAIEGSVTAAGLTARRVPLPGLPPVQTKHGEDVSDWLDDGHTPEELEVLITSTAVHTSADPLGGSPGPRFAEGAGEFLARTFPPVEIFIEAILTGEGSGFIGGEEKLGKTYYALAEAFSLAMGIPFCTRFAVPVRRRVLFIEEEDSPRRTHLRLRAIARGAGFDPDEAAFQADLSAWFRLAIWSGFRLDEPAWLSRLDAELAAFPAAVVYLDVLRKLTKKDLSKQDQMAPLFDDLDLRRRARGCLFRVLHHYRKSQGLRMGRGSQEMGGSFVLAAWAEQSVFLEPIGRKGGGTSVDVQLKDAAASSTLHLRWEVEGPAHEPQTVRLHLDDLRPDQAPGQKWADQVLQLLATLPQEPSPHGAGVTIKALMAALRKSRDTIRRTLDFLIETGAATQNSSPGTKHRRYNCNAPSNTVDALHLPEQGNLL